MSLQPHRVTAGLAGNKHKESKLKLTSHQETDSTTHLDKWRKQHHESLNLWFICTAQKSSAVVFVNNTATCLLCLRRHACTHALIATAHVPVRRWWEVDYQERNKVCTYLISKHLTSSLSMIITMGHTHSKAHTAGWMSDIGMTCVTYWLRVVMSTALNMTWITNLTGERKKKEDINTCIQNMWGNTNGSKHRSEYTLLVSTPKQPCGLYYSTTIPQYLIDPWKGN